MLKSLFTHERGKVYRVIAELKRSIRELEAISPRIPKIEAALKESKDLEQQLLKASKDPGFIKNLMNKSLIETKTKADTFSNKQKEVRNKRKTWKGLSPAEREERNQKIKEHFKKSKLTLNSFAKKHSKKYDLSVRHIRTIILS